MAKVTIKDVAREAGVSISTVSNALNDVDVLRPETKAHVLSVAERLHYIPNLNGRNLKAQASKVIGMFVPSLGGPCMGMLADGVARQCREDGYELNVFVASKSMSVMANLLGRRVDGAVIMDGVLSPGQEADLAEAEIPVVYVNNERAGRYRAGVVFDSYAAGRMAAECLLKSGARRFGVMAGPDNYDANERLKGFKDTLDAKRIAIRPEHIFQGNFSRKDAARAMTAFLRNPRNRVGANLPDAIFAVNDESAIGCMEALAQAGISVPRNVRVMGCDNIELGSYTKPALTTVNTNFEEQGAMAVRVLMRMLKGEVEGMRIKLSCKLVERDSV